MARVERAVLREKEVGIERKERSAIISKHRLARGIEMGAGRGEQDKRPAQGRGELGDCAAKIIGSNLDGEDGGDGIGGPGADLEGVGGRQFHKFADEAKGFAEGAAEFRKIDFERSNLRTSERNVGAKRRVAATDSHRAFAVMTRDDMMRATAVLRTGIRCGQPIGGVETDGRHSGELGPHTRLPDLGVGA